VTRGGAQRAVIYNGQVLCAPCPAGAIARRKARTAVACPLINGNELISNGAAIPGTAVVICPLWFFWSSPHATADMPAGGFAEGYMMIGWSVRLRTWETWLLYLAPRVGLVGDLVPKSAGYGKRRTDTPWP